MGIDLSIVVLAWNQLELTRRCVDSIRARTDVEYELIIVDNGSTREAREFASSAADIAVLHDTNRGFARGMNAGLDEATGEFVAFVNNDTRLPETWASHLIETATSGTSPGVVLPAVTKAGNPVSVRDAPGDSVITLVPFAEFPSGVVYLIQRKVIKSLGGWNEDYEQASAEDLDLVFSVWAHGLDVILDERVLVDHVSQASVRHLEGRQTLYRQNLEQFLQAWEDPANHKRKLDTLDNREFVSNLERAQTAVIWIRRMLEARDRADDLARELAALHNRPNPVARWFRSRC